MKNKEAPEWYPLPIHEKNLSPVEWANAISSRVTGLFLTAENLSNDLKVRNFEDFVLNLWGRWENSDRPIAGNVAFNEPSMLIPTTLIQDNSGADWLKVSSHFAIPANHTVPLVINTFFDDGAIIEKVKDLISEKRKEQSSRLEGAALGIIDNSPFYIENFNPSLQMKRGTQPFKEHEFKKWESFKVLDFIDLTLWGMLTGVEYEDAFFFRLFWGHDYDDLTKNKDSINTTKRWAYELLHPSSSYRLNASVD